MGTYKDLHAKYKDLLQKAYKVSKTDKVESGRLYAEADKLRSELFAH